MQNENRQEANNETIAVLVDTRKLAQKCQQLEWDLESEKKQRIQQDETIERMLRESALVFRFAELGRREVERRKNETLSRLAAIVHFSGDRERLRTMQRMLADSSLDPTEIASIHHRISEEFHALYPTQPVSCLSVERSDSDRSSSNWSDYRLRP